MACAVLIVDDHQGYRALARELLEREGVEVVGEAGDGEAAIAASVALRPTVVLLDVNLPGADGFVVAEQLSRLPEAPRVVLISSRAASDYGPLLAGAHAAGFLHKGDVSAAAISALLG